MCTVLLVVVPLLEVQPAPHCFPALLLEVPLEPLTWTQFLSRSEAACVPTWRAGDDTGHLETTS